MELFINAFGATTRTLTSFGTGPLSVQTVQNATIAANSTVNFSQVAGTVVMSTILALADATGSVVIQMTDGTNTWTVVTIAAGTTGGTSPLISVGGTFAQLHNNSATVAAHYGAASLGLVQ